MKQIVFILFLIPSLCFAQLGINVPNPEATLHIKPKGNLPPLVIENIDNKSFDEKRPYNKLIIDDDGIVKQQEPENIVTQKSRKIYRYYLKNNLRVGGYLTSGSKSNREVSLMTPDSEIELFKIENTDKTTIKFPKTARFGVILRIHAVLKYDNVKTPGKTLFFRDPIRDFMTGILNIHIGPYSRFKDTDQDSKSAQFLVSQFDNKMYINVMFEATGEEGKKLHFSFFNEPFSWSDWLVAFHKHYESTNAFNNNGPIILLGYEENKSNKNVLHETTNITMWELD